MIEIGTLLQERYLIEKQIGAGGMGAVYLAVDKRFDNHVAIKETFYRDQELAEAFEREARLLNALQHPALPHVSDYFAENSGYFLVMQFIEGEDLSDILKRDGSFAVEDVMRWTDNLLAALDYLHSQEIPIIHRDIKPHNLKLTPRGDIILLDFGLAKLNSDETTSEKSVFGYSRTYSPLEQIQGTGTDGRSDIFALGATVYHLLTGRPPIDALARAAAIVNGKPDPLKSAGEINPKISPELAGVLNSALALNPEHRFATAKAMRHALGYAEPVASPETVNGARATAFAAGALASAQKVKDGVPVEEFPALEAFAAGDDQKSAVENAPLVVPVISGAAGMSDPYRVRASPYSTMVVDQNESAPPQSKNDKKFILWTVAALAVLAVVAGGWFLANRAGSAQENVTPPVAEASPGLKPERKTTEQKSDGAAESKAKQEAKAKKAENKNEPEPETAEVAETTPVLPAEAERRDPTPARRPTQRESGETNPEEDVVDASEVETVFTGKKDKKRSERLERRRIEEIPDEMSEEEFKQLQRENRERRREKRRQQREREIPF